MVTEDQIDALASAAKSAMENAYARYSRFRVGAAVLCESGEIHCGCNVENASYGLSICAERTAIFRAVCAGNRWVTAVAIAVSSGEAAFPCGACRQVMAEFAPKGGTMDVLLVSDSGVCRYTLEELLPHAFRLE